MNNEICRQWYERSYLAKGFAAQRLYPNEEFLRFMGNNFFLVPFKDRKKVKFLELGCGSCANLWMLAKEGFGTWGIDISEEAIKLGKEMLKHWGVGGQVRLYKGDMANPPFRNNFFDVVFDILSIHCLNIDSFKNCLHEVRRILKHNGYFFSYAISTNSDAFRNFKPAKKINAFTLDGIKRKNSPYYGNNYPTRFISPESYKKLLTEMGFKVVYLETISRTSRHMKEKFEYISIIGKKI